MLHFLRAYQIDSRRVILIQHTVKIERTERGGTLSRRGITRRPTRVAAELVAKGNDTKRILTISSKKSPGLK